MESCRIAEPPDANPEGWQYYPTNLEHYDPVMTRGAGLIDQINLLSDVLFDEDVSVRVIDACEEAGSLSCRHRIYNQESELRNEISQVENPRIRIISIHQSGSITPLRITRELMLRILTHYKVVPEFLEVLISFGSCPHPGEAGSSNIAVVDVNETKHTCYQFRYAEKNHRSPRQPWSIRQTGIYHQHSAHFDFWILLNPVEKSNVERQLELLEKTRHASALRKIRDNPFHLHSVVWESYIRNWRWYVRFLGDRFDDMNGLAFLSDSNRATPGVLNFTAVQQLRDMYDDALALSAYCSGDLKVVETLKQQTSMASSQHLEPYEALLLGYIESLTLLQSRICNILDLIANTLDIKSYYAADAAMDDSATIKLITIFSLIYLPGTFAGTLYGMNFFWYNSQTRRIQIGSDFWIYVLTWLGLTAITMLTYLMFMRRHRKLSKFGRR